MVEVITENALAFQVEIDHEHTLHAYVLDGDLKHVGISFTDEEDPEPEDLILPDLHTLSVAVDAMKRELQKRGIDYGEDQVK